MPDLEYGIQKIGISNGINVRSVCWNPDEDWIAFGGQDGSTNVFKLDQSGALEGAKICSTAGLSHFSMNQVLSNEWGICRVILLGIVGSVKRK